MKFADARNQVIQREYNDAMSISDVIARCCELLGEPLTETQQSAVLTSLLNHLQVLKAESEYTKGPIRSPKGSATCATGTGGRCFVCDLEFGKEDTICRCAKTQLVQSWKTVTHDGIHYVREQVTTSAIVGYRVCRWCSPTIRDWELDRYSIGMDKWPESWKNYEDTGVFGSKSVEVKGR